MPQDTTIHTLSQSPLCEGVNKLVTTIYFQQETAVSVLCSRAVARSWGCRRISLERVRAFSGSVASFIWDAFGV